MASKDINRFKGKMNNQNMFMQRQHEKKKSKQDMIKEIYHNRKKL